MTDLKKWIFRYVINDVTYYYGTRRGGIIGFETDVMNFEDTVTHVIYDPDRIISEDEIVHNKGQHLRNYYDLTKKILTDLIVNDLYDRCDVIDRYYTFNYTYTGLSYDHPILEFIYLHDDFDITNSRNEIYTIKGLASTWNYTLIGRNVTYDNVKGFRTKVTDLESGHRGYRHSHLRANQMYDHTAYCLGTSDVSSRKRSHTAIEDLDILYDVVIMDSFVRWESLEGGPHTQIQNIIPINYVIVKPCDLTDDIIKKMMIKPSFDSARNVFYVTVKIDNDDSIIDIFNDTNDSYQFKGGGTYGVNRNDMLNLFKDPRSSSTDRYYYFKGNKEVQKVGYSKEEISRMLTSMFIKNTYNVSNIETELNIMINNDIYRPSIEEATI